MSYHTMLKKKKVKIHPSIQIHTKNQFWSLFWAENHLFCVNKFSRFVFNPADKPTNQQKDTGENIT